MVCGKVCGNVEKLEENVEKYVESLGLKRDNSP